MEKACALYEMKDDYLVSLMHARARIILLRQKRLELIKLACQAKTEKEEAALSFAERELLYEENYEEKNTQIFGHYIRQLGLRLQKLEEMI